MLLRIRQIARVYLVVLCFGLACQAITPSEMEKVFKSKILAAMKKNRIAARAASSGSGTVNSPAPSVVQTNPRSISKAETSVPATTSGGKTTNPIKPSTVETLNGETKPETVVADSVSSSTRKPIMSNSLDAQSVDVNINIKNNINNPVTTGTVQQKKTTTESNTLDCAYACLILSLRTCGCDHGAWA